jgi:hypothetical protein
MKTHRSLALLLCAALLSACGEDAVQNITTPATGARVKFFNFGVNTPSVNFFAGDQKVSAVTSTDTIESVNGTASGSAASGGFYQAVNAGQYTLTGRISAATDKNLPISTVSTTLADGKLYSYFISGIYNTTAKTADAFVIEDVLPVTTTDFSTAYVRFVNAISNAPAQTLFAKSTVTGTETAIGGAVAYKSAGEFVKLPAGLYDLNTRASGSSANAISRTAVSFNAGRVYTIASRGDMTVTSTTAATRPQLDNTANR